jgi:hypothetical protein
VGASVELRARPFPAHGLCSAQCTFSLHGARSISRLLAERRDVDRSTWLKCPLHAARLQAVASALSKQGT